MATISFTGTLAQIQAQCLEFIGITQAQYADALAGTTHVAPPDAHAGGGSAGLPPLPPNAPPGAYWIKSLGAPSLRDAAGNVLAVDWAQTPPVVVPNPPRTPDGGSLSGEDFKNILDGKTP